MDIVTLRKQVIVEFKDELKKFYKFLKRNNHLNWAKPKIKKRFIVWLRRIDLTKSYAIIVNKNKELAKKKEEELAKKKEEEEASSVKRIYNFEVKSYKFNYCPSTNTVRINATWYHKATEKEKEDMEKKIKVWVERNKKVDRGGKADWHYHVLSAIDGNRGLGYEFSNRMKTTCYKWLKSPHFIKITISKRWFDCATDDELKKFYDKIKSLPNLYR